MHSTRYTSLVLLAVLAVLVLAPASASAAADIYPNTTPIAIPSSGAASPYGSAVNVTGRVGPVTDVKVTLNGVGHGRPSDLRMVLVSPSGDYTALMTGNCGPTAIDNFTWLFDQRASTPMPVGAECPDVLYRPAPTTNNVNLPGPAPVAPYPRTLDIFRGENPNGEWKLYVADNVGGFGGEIKRGWTLTLSTGDVDATIPGTGTSGPANPYPATVDVSGNPGVITDLDVVLNGVWHERPDDLDLLLVGPRGQSVVLASDACGTAPVVGADWHWNDEALGPMPDGDASPRCGSGQYQPVDHDPGDAPPGPAPAPPYAGKLSAFDLTDPNGQWKLFVLDDESGKTGFLTNRFDLEMTTREKATVAFTESAVRLDESGRRELTLRRSASSDLLAGEVKVTTAPGSAGSPGDFTPVSTTVRFGPGEREKRVAIDARTDGTREGDETYAVAIDSPGGDARLGNPSRVGVTIEGSAPTAGGAGPAPRCAGKRATIVGTRGRNRLRGTRRRDVIVALGGNDVIRGGGGNDTICAGSGKDRVSGGRGNDRIAGDAGNDRLAGDAGRDRLSGGRGRDRCVGGPGRDRASCERKRSI